MSCFAAGEGSAIGQVYAANTLGAIAAFCSPCTCSCPSSGLKLALVLGASTTLLLGAWLLRYSQSAARRIHAMAAVLIGMLAAAGTARAEILDPERLSSGVFRYAQVTPDFRARGLLPRRQDRFGGGARPSEQRHRGHRHERQARRGAPPGSEAAADPGRIHDEPASVPAPAH